MELTAAAFLTELDARRSDAELAKYERYFPLAERGDDVFIGVRMGEVFAMAKERAAMPLAEVEELLESSVHEARVGAVSVMDFQSRARATTPERRQELFSLYLRRHDRIDTWDLVDRSAIHVVGDYLVDHPRDVLDELARSAHPIRRRTALIATFAFVSRGDASDSFRLARMLVDDPADVVQKAVGWVVRTAGGPGLIEFLDEHAATMPRPTLRAALEKLPAPQRAHYLALAKSSRR
ncbi:DNA alkylation repair protein [Herbiconiux sp. CPCC 205763]|uniref:DNA alkylation repair protein n=1 Tax=Herbiconiux aconitum TaxID=2970913 RepID=A0ABT2GRS6_9MICO|nr:DNA alkylation repair protein [Herbiconiux aconitum]MCS5718929.1 DNA alkylation repair protein [Herbiconiux aconitum]